MRGDRACDIDDAGPLLVFACMRGIGARLQQSKESVCDEKHAPDVQSEVRTPIIKRLRVEQRLPIYCGGRTLWCFTGRFRHE